MLSHLLFCTYRLQSRIAFGLTQTCSVLKGLWGQSNGLLRERREEQRTFRDIGDSSNSEEWLGLSVVGVLVSLP